MAPPLAVALGPLVTVPLVLLLEALAATPMLVQTRREVRWRVIGPILVFAALTIPAGGYVLMSVDPAIMRRVIAGVVVLFSSLLLFGWRYAGPQRTATSVGLGALSGAMVGATGMGGPPVILYLLAGPDSIQVTRANLTFYVAGISAGALVMLFANGVLDLRVTWLAIVMTPGYYLGTILGTRLFSRFNDQRFRRFTLLFMLVVSVGILVS
jgi:uncharacterized membrane protein YfcA